MDDDPVMMTQVIVPAAITDAVLSTSNVPETDHAEWNAGTGYTAGERVIVVAVHKVYEALFATTGDDPTTSPGQWLELGATNRWKAFDHKVSDVVLNADSIEYTLIPPTLADGLAFFNLNAASLHVAVVDAVEATIYEKEIALTDTSTIVDWYEFFVWDAPQTREVVLFGVPGHVGFKVQITISATGATAQVGQIVMGRNTRLGRAAADTRPGFTDFSRKDRDDFGNPIIIERAFSSRVTYIFSFPRADTGRILRTMADLRAKPAVYTLGPETSHLGTTVYGFMSGDLDIPLMAADVAVASLEIEGLI